MTARTITTTAELDALPDEHVLLEASGRYRYIRGTFEQCWVRPVPSSITGTDERMWEVLTYGAEIPSSLVHSEDLDLPVTVLHDPSAPVVPVVSDAAVEAASAEQCGAWGGCSLPHGHNLGRADIPMNHRVPSATREDVETITIPRPHVPHGPATVAWDVADADYLRRAARDLEEVYKPFGSNLRATIVALIRDAADAITPRTDR